MLTITEIMHQGIIIIRGSHSEWEDSLIQRNLWIFLLGILKESLQILLRIQKSNTSESMGRLGGVFPEEGRGSGCVLKQ